MWVYERQQLPQAFETNASSLLNLQKQKQIQWITKGRNESPSANQNILSYVSLEQCRNLNRIWPVNLNLSSPSYSPDNPHTRSRLPSVFRFMMLFAFRIFCSLITPVSCSAILSRISITMRFQPCLVIDMLQWFSLPPGAVSSL